MTKIRVHELAKKLAIDNKSIISALESIGVKGKSHSSSLEDHIVQKIKRVLLGYEVEPEPSPAPKRVRKKTGKAVAEEPQVEEVVQPSKITRRTKAEVEGIVVEPEEVQVQPEGIEPETIEPVGEGIPAEAGEAEISGEKKPEAAPKKPAKQQKKSERKVVINLAEMQAAASRMDGEGPASLDDLPKIQESLKRGVDLEALRTEGESGDEEAEKNRDKLTKEISKEKLQKFKGKAFQTLDQVQTAASAAQTVHPALARVRGRRRPAKGRKGGPVPVGRSSRPGGPEVTTAPRRKDIKFREGTTVKEFSELIGQKVTEVIKKLMSLGMMATLNHPLDADAAQLVAEGFGLNLETVEVESEESILEEVVDDEASLETRAPVVTVMGHVDHGKTSLLDAIRKTRVTEGEAGGITQHIGAYRVRLNDRDITFLDTPGHAAFTAMRARGAKITDVVVLVVAADDGVMPQTVEAIDHAKAAEVPLVVAINKMDKPEANPDRVKAELAERGLNPEEWGGQTIFCEVSAKKNEGIEHLLEMLLLQADVLELRANPDRMARGTVIEARLDRGRGPVASMLVQTGTLRNGDIVLSGTIYGKVRTLNDENGKRLDAAGPSVPVEVVGLSGVPAAGDPFVVLEDERKARQIALAREEKVRSQEMATRPKLSLDELHRLIAEGEVKDLNLLVKGDVQGSVEAVRDALLKISHPEVKVNVIHASPGGITERDVMLAAASNAIIIGFNVRPESKARQIAESDGIDIRLYNVIYKAVDDIKLAMEGMLAPTLTEKILGRAEVRQTFHVSRIGTIAGCYVIEGIITRTATGIRVIRDNVVIYDGRIGSLKRFQEDTKEVATGYECGLTVENFNDIKVGDILEDYTIESVATKLEG